MISINFMSLAAALLWGLCLLTPITWSGTCNLTVIVFHHRQGVWKAFIPSSLPWSANGQTRFLIPYFHQKNLVLLGDAAHPLLPFTSQGVCAAIADAVTLAELLLGCDHPAQMLNCYSTVRRAKCAPYIHEGRKLRDRFLMPLSAESVLLPIVDDQRALAAMATT